MSSDSQIELAEEDDAEESEDVADEDEISTELEDAGKENVSLESLPQGVSYDRESDAFKLISAIPRQDDSSSWENSQLQSVHTKRTSKHFQDTIQISSLLQLYMLESRGEIFCGVP